MTRPIEILKNSSHGAGNFSITSSKGSFSLDDDLFSLFCDPFTTVHPKGHSQEFNFFGPNEFEPQELEQLSNSFRDHLDKLKTCKSLNELKETFGSRFFFQSKYVENLKQDFEKTMSDFIKIDEEIINLVQMTKQSGQTLYVYGI